MRMSWPCYRAEIVFPLKVAVTLLRPLTQLHPNEFRDAARILGEYDLDLLPHIDIVINLSNWLVVV